ncbi:MAG: NDP-hexose 2,3-dehydratase family protein [Candidatus Avigastranaerophilus sp.]
MNSKIQYKLLESLFMEEGNVNSTEEILFWLDNLNRSTHVDISETTINEDSFWFYDDRNGEILNRKRSFFSITGMRLFTDDKFIIEQPIIVQNEIGYLGIIAKEIDGVINFLMQAKIEPGNVNCVQLSPTIQATKSNFTRAHGGRLPHYFEWFDNAGKTSTVIYDQIQSEQGSRFSGKRNRNIIILTDKEIPLHPNYKWMTLGQIKTLLTKNNLVNMDTRTVLSALPVIIGKNAGRGGMAKKNSPLYKSMYESDFSDFIKANTLLNNYKMYHEVHKTFIPLNQLVDWEIDNYGITSKKPADFCVRYYNIEIHGREVQNWVQPLFKAQSMALFVLFTAEDNGVQKFLISLRPEIGCFDKVEFAPSIQISNEHNTEATPLYETFKKYEKSDKHIIKDVILSEEGGRFYHEQNRNVIMKVKINEISLPEGFIWVDYASLNLLINSNNNLNIQLRNLISLLDFKELIC